MKKSRFTEEQIITALKEHERGGTANEICRRLGVSTQTFYRWKAKYGGMEVSQARRLREVEEENRRLKHIVAEQALDIRALKDVVSRKW
jgi:putative transposase